MSVAIRITRSVTDLLPLFTKLLDYSPHTRYIAYQHDSDEQVSRTHTHILVTDTFPSVETIKNYLREIFPGITKSDYAFKTKYKPRNSKVSVPVDEKFITYMSKGKFDCAISRGFTDEQIQRYKAQWVDYETISKKEEAVTSYTMAQELARYIEATYTEEPVDFHYVDIVNQAIDIHNRHHKGFNDHSLIRVIQTAFGMGNTPFRAKMITLITRKLICYDHI